MLAGSIADSKLNTITTANKVSGSAVQLNATNPCIADDTGLEVVVDDSSIERTAGGLQVKASGVTNDMLAGSIADSKLSTITTANKVSGSAVQLAATSAIEDSTGLRIKDATAGDGLGITNQVMKVNVDDSSIEISTDTLQVKALGITNAMLAGSIADSKLSTITTANKVSGSAVQLGTNPGLEDSTGLKVKLDGSTLTVGASGLKLSDLTDGWVLMGNSSNVATAMRMVTRETPNEAPDGSRTTFTVDYTPRNGTEQIYVNGILQIEGAGESYTLSGSTITFSEAPSSGDKVRVSYLATN